MIKFCKELVDDHLRTAVLIEQVIHRMKALKIYLKLIHKGLYYWKIRGTAKTILCMQNREKKLIQSPCACFFDRWGVRCRWRQPIRNNLLLGAKGKRNFEDNKSEKGTGEKEKANKREKKRAVGIGPKIVTEPGRKNSERPLLLLGCCALCDHWGGLLSCTDTPTDCSAKATWTASGGVDKHRDVAESVPPSSWCQQLPPPPPPWSWKSGSKASSALFAASQNAQPARSFPFFFYFSVKFNQKWKQKFPHKIHGNKTNSITSNAV